MEDKKEVWDMSTFDLNREIESWELKNKKTMIKIEEMKEDLEEITKMEDIILRSLSE